MPKLSELCPNIRSKNAGPFWVTVDLFFEDEAAYALCRAHPALRAEKLAQVFGADPAAVKRFAVDSLRVIKFSYPRSQPQGGVLERDMHSGQQYVRLLDIEVG